MDADSFLSGDESWPPTELIGGRIVVDCASALHQEVLIRILLALRGWTEGPAGHGHVAIPLDVRISDHDVLTPDVLWYADASRVAWKGAQLIPPDLVVEVRSPSTWSYDTGPKLGLYEGAGVQELWLVDTVATSVLVHRRTRAGASGFDEHLEIGADGTLTSPRFPGLAVPVGETLSVGG